jgi:hypothetical protein
MINSNKYKYALILEMGVYMRSAIYIYILYTRIGHHQTQEVIRFGNDGFVVLVCIYHKLVLSGSSVFRDGGGREVETKI